MKHKRVRREKRVALEDGDRESHFFTNSYFVIFLVFYFTRTYTISYDYLLLLPFFYICMGFFSRTALFFVLFFGFFYGICSQFITWNPWHKRGINNPNYFFGDTVTICVVLSIWSYNLVCRLSEKVD